MFNLILLKPKDKLVYTFFFLLQYIYFLILIHMARPHAKTSTLNIIITMMTIQDFKENITSVTLKKKKKG